MSKLTHRIAPEVKADILRRVKDEGVSVAQAAKDHGIHESTIYNWLGAGVKGTPSWSDLAKVSKQNKELMDIIGELTVRLSVAQKKN
jgi:transposase-like protein